MSHGRGRVLLACDSCRQRKSRCDGLRPRCSHCHLSGRACLYRAAPTSVDTDSSVLARLAETEARLQALEEKNRILTASLLGSPGYQSLHHTDGLHAPVDAGLAPSRPQQNSQHDQQQQQQQQQQQPLALKNGHVDSGTPHGGSRSTISDVAAARVPPDLHTAAAFKLLTCWPRLTLNMTIPGLDTQTYLTLCDQADPMLQQLVGAVPAQQRDGMHDHGALQLAPWQATAALERLYSPAAYQQLPLAMLVLLESYPGLCREHILAGFSEAASPGAGATPGSMDGVGHRFGRPRHAFSDHGSLYSAAANDASVLDYSRLSFAQLLALSIAMQIAAAVSGGVDGGNGMNGINISHNSPGTPLELGPADAMAVAMHTCSLALQRLWILRAGPAQDLVPLVLMLANYLMHFWVRPFHALGLLQSVDPAIKHMAVLQADNPRIPIYARLHFLLESDIITELNGFSTLSSVALLGMPPMQLDAVARPGAAAAAAVASPLAPSPAMTSTTTGTLAGGTGQGTGTMAGYIENHVRLRIFLNRVLHLLYAPTQAYAQPHELADLVCSLAASLRDWYQAQPLDQQFVRDATTYSINTPSMGVRLRETALRYFGCMFLLHRPVLYFFLHKDLEYTMRPPDTARTQHVDREPWVLESCRDCIESAALLIHLSCGQDGRGHDYGSSSSSSSSSSSGSPTLSWCDLQMLFAAYLILLQARSVPSLVPVLRNVGDMDALLDKAERAFAAGALPSLILDKSLAILQDERRNFEAASPVAHMT